MFRRQLIVLGDKSCRVQHQGGPSRHRSSCTLRDQCRLSQGPFLRRTRTFSSGFTSTPPGSESSPTWLAATVFLFGAPVWIWFCDTSYSFRRIHGTSMSPTLQPGDVVLVRQSDRGVLAEALMSPLLEILASRQLSSVDQENEQEEEQHRRRIHRHEVGRGVLEHANLAKWYDRPVLALPGHIVVFHSPTSYPPEPVVKRVVGVSGQYIIGSQFHDSSADQTKNDRPSTNMGWRMIPSYAIHVEGDNLANSQDSRHYGPVSKNLVCGLVEAIVWPPSRWQYLKRDEPSNLSSEVVPGTLNSHQPSRAFWP
jgi:signal peptidase I